MNPCCASSPAPSVEVTARLARIVNAVNELNRCIDQYRFAENKNEQWGIFLGEMDWCRELHRLLYEGD